MSATAAVTSETTTAAEMSAAAAAAAMCTTKDQAREEVRHQSPWRSLQEVRTCEHPDCAFLVHSNPFIGSGRYCCEKCEGLHQGAEWAQTKGNRHYKNCERLEAPLHAGGVSPSRPESGEFERGVHVST